MSCCLQPLCAHAVERMAVQSESLPERKPHREEHRQGKMDDRTRDGPVRMDLTGSGPIWPIRGS